MHHGENITKIMLFLHLIQGEFWMSHDIHHMET